MELASLSSFRFTSKNTPIPDHQENRNEISIQRKTERADARARTASYYAHHCGGRYPGDAADDFGEIVLVHSTVRTYLTTAQKKTQPVCGSLMGNTELRPDEVEFVPTETPAAANDYASMIDRAGAAQMEATVPENTNGVSNVPYNLARTIRDDVLGVLSLRAMHGSLP